MTRAQLMRSMSAEEFNEWKIIHSKFAPFGLALAELQAGLAAAPLLNIQLGKGSRRFDPVDWIGLSRSLLNPKPAEPQSQEQIKKAFMAIAEAMSKKGKKPQKPPTVPSVASGVPVPPDPPANPAQPKARRNSATPAGRRARKTRSD